MEARLQVEVGRWRMIGRSIRGASHVRSGLPNQDSIGWIETAQGAALLAAVADGHGSPKCFRSDAGSRFAVEAAKETVSDFLQRGDPAGAEGLPEQLVRAWRSRVYDHLRQEPLSPALLQDLERRMGRTARASIEAEPSLAYGATVLAAAVTASSALYLQLGDGDILAVSPEAAVSRPWARDPRHFGGETTSLAAPDAAQDVRLRVVAGDALPELILLSTDGYADSFREEDGFLAVGCDLIRMIREEGIGPIEANLEGWLWEASELGSGDDVTVGILWREPPAT